VEDSQIQHQQCHHDAEEGQPQPGGLAQKGNLQELNQSVQEILRNECYLKLPSASGGTVTACFAVLSFGVNNPCGFSAGDALPLMRLDTALDMAETETASAKKIVKTRLMARFSSIQKN
jgi:hypothetical protein